MKHEQWDKITIPTKNPCSQALNAADDRKLGRSGFKSGGRGTLGVRVAKRDRQLGRPVTSPHVNCC